MDFISLLNYTHISLIPQLIRIRFPNLASAGVKGLTGDYTTAPLVLCFAFYARNFRANAVQYRSPPPFIIHGG